MIFEAVMIGRLYTNSAIFHWLRAARWSGGIFIADFSISISSFIVALLEMNLIQSIVLLSRLVNLYNKAFQKHGSDQKS